MLRISFCWEINIQYRSLHGTTDYWVVLINVGDVSIIVLLGN